MDGGGSHPLMSRTIGPNLTAISVWGPLLTFLSSQPLPHPKPSAHHSALVPFRPLEGRVLEAGDPASAKALGQEYA